MQPAQLFLGKTTSEMNFSLRDNRCEARNSCR